MDNQKQVEPRPDSPSPLKTMEMKRRLSWTGLLFCLIIAWFILITGFATTQNDPAYMWIALSPLIGVAIVALGFAVIEMVFPEELVEVDEGQDE